MELEENIHSPYSRMIGPNETRTRDLLLTDLFFFVLNQFIVTTSCLKYYTSNTDTYGMRQNKI